MERGNMKKVKGFTIIEVAIVLVIIGLLLGGISKGQAIVERAKLKNVAADFQFYASAYDMYKEQNSYLATQYIDNLTDTETPWKLLREAELVKVLADSDISFNPEHSLDGVFEFRSATDANPVFERMQLCATQLSMANIKEIDLTQDDGLPNQGKYQIEDTLSAYPTAASELAELNTLCKEL
jgi:prepilin-type N-terminal cleavage/methylation domain-containing protein